jgi:hypothetical protein
MMTSHSAAAVPFSHVIVRSSEKNVNDEAEVVHAYPAVHVPEPSQAHHKHAGDDHEAEDHPEQVEAVARGQRIDVDAAEHVRQGDQHDRDVDRRHEHAKRRVRQNNPLVTVRAHALQATAAQPARSAGGTGCRPVP